MRGCTFWRGHSEYNIGLMARVDQADVEHVELDPEKKREILRLEEELGRMNHFEVLGLPPGASPAEVKQSYYEASLKYHPDRFYQKKLGSFGPRIERIFRRLTEANVVLTDPKKRSEYQRVHPESPRAQSLTTAIFTSFWTKLGLSRPPSGAPRKSSGQRAPRKTAIWIWRPAVTGLPPISTGRMRRRPPMRREC